MELESLELDILDDFFEHEDGDTIPETDRCVLEAFRSELLASLSEEGKKGHSNSTSEVGPIEEGIEVDDTGFQAQQVDGNADKLSVDAGEELTGVLEPSTTQNSDADMNEITNATASCEKEVSDPQSDPQPPTLDTEPSRSDLNDEGNENTAADAIGIDSVEEGISVLLEMDTVENDNETAFEVIPSAPLVTVDETRNEGKEPDSEMKESQAVSASEDANESSAAVELSITEAELELEKEASVENDINRVDSSDTDPATSNPTSAGTDIECDPEVLQLQERISARRIERDEVYSRMYKPTDGEAQELIELETKLGVARRSGFLARALGKAIGGRASGNDAWERLVRPDEGKKEGHSVLLKRGPCVWKVETGKGHDAVECEAILLTRGLVLAALVVVGSSGTNIRSSFSKAILWSDVCFVCPKLGDNHSWQVLLGENSAEPTETWTFMCANTNSRDAWLSALERIVIEYHMHSQGPLTTKLGWQYQVVHKQAFTMAVTGKADEYRPRRTLLETRDSYNGYTPLHYAVRCQQEMAVKAFLKIGADPNAPCTDDISPMTYATQDEVSQSIIDLLLSNGGQVVKPTNKPSALFGQVEAVETKRQIEHGYEQKERQAKAAQAEMNENMRLLRERGEKIDEMSSKAADLNLAAQDYKSMSKKLKEKLKQKSKWVPWSK